MVSKFFDKKSSDTGAKSEIIPNQKLTEELPKPIIKKFEKRKVYLSFKGNIWGAADIGNVQLISKFNKRFWFLSCVVDIYSKYAWVVSLKNKRVTTITNDFQKFLDESNRKLNKIWVDKGSEFYNRLTKSWLQDNYIIKSVVAERLIRTLKNKIYKYMTSVSKNVYIDQPSIFLIFFFFL